MQVVGHVLLYDVILGLVHLGVDAFLVYSYFSQGDSGWASATLTAIALPGFLELIVYVYSYLHGDLQGSRNEQLKELFSWVLFSLFFPLSLVFWHLKLLIQGKQEILRYENAARSRVLNSLSVLTKSALQLVLQTLIILVTWHRVEEENEDNEILKTLHLAWPVTSAVISLVVLAKSGTDHHFFESSGKDVDARPRYKAYIQRLVLNVFHILARTVVLALLGSYLRVLGLPFLALGLLLNYGAASFLLKTAQGKHFWTSFAAILFPTCFVSRDDIRGKEKGYGGRLFARFYQLNSLLFLLVSTASLVTTCLLLKYSSFLTFSCPDLPLLSHLPDCPGLFSSEVLGLTDSHAWFYLLGSLTVLLLASLHTMVIFLTENTRGSYTSQRMRDPSVGLQPV